VQSYFEDESVMARIIKLGQWEKHEGVSTTGSPSQPSDKSDATVFPLSFLIYPFMPQGANAGFQNYPVQP
jgi:hypothetical protein